MPDPKPKTRKRPAAPKKAAPPPPDAAQVTSGVVDLEGYVVWLYLAGDNGGMYERFDILRGVFRENAEIALDFDCAHPGEPPHIYSISLRRESALLFRGEWLAGNPEDRDSGSCSCRVYFNDARLGLFGVWRRNGEAHHWIAELRPVDTTRPPDDNVPSTARR